MVVLINGAQMGQSANLAHANMTAKSQDPIHPKNVDEFVSMTKKYYKILSRINNELANEAPEIQMPKVHK